MNSHGSFHLVCLISDYVLAIQFKFYRFTATFSVPHATASLIFKSLSLPLIVKSAMRLNEITYTLLASYCPACL